jgi:DNA-damage-inducible protein J
MSSHLANENHHNHGQHLFRNTVVRARVNSDVKHKVESVLNRLGLTMSEAISLYLSQIQLEGGIPFAVKIPNQVTLKTFAETDQSKNVKKAKSVREIFQKAGL